jgi:CheY-specific phosphatase CheX
MVNNKGLNALRSAALLLVSSNLVSAAPASLPPRGAPKAGDQLCGPTTFHQGLSPGGGGNDLVIDAGCCIIVPLNNTIPTPVCSPPDEATDEVANTDKRKIKGSEIFDAGTSVVDAGLTLAGIIKGAGSQPSAQPSAQPAQKRSLQDDMDNINEFLSQAGVQARDEKRKIKGSEIFDASTSVVDAGLTLAGVIKGAGSQPSAQPSAQPAQKRSLQDDMDNINEFLSQAGLQARDEKRTIEAADVIDAGKSVVNAGLTLASIFESRPSAQPSAQPAQRRSLQDDMDNINEFLSQVGVQARDEKRKIKGSQIFDAGTSVVDAGLTLASLFGSQPSAQPSAQPAQKRSAEPSLQDDMDNINEFLSQAQSGSLDTRSISGSSILSSIKNIADVASIAGQAAGLFSKRSLQDDMDNINEFLSQAQSGELEARKLSGSSIINSIKNVADVVGLAGTVGQATGILPKRSLQDDMNNINEFLSQVQSGSLDTRSISGSSIPSSIKNIADVVGIAGQAAGLFAKRSLQDDIDQLLNQVKNDELVARKISGSSIINSIKNVADVVGLAGTVAQATGISSRDLTATSLDGSNGAPKLGPGIALGPFHGPAIGLGPGIALNNFGQNQNQKRSASNDIKELLNALGSATLGARDE